MKFYNTEKVVIKSWCNNLEEGALVQAKNLANLPFIFRHVALMPDCHQGYGMPIGGVIGTQGVVIPNAVGVDIGCGMCAVKTNIMDIGKQTLKQIMGDIRKLIPLGFNHHAQKQDESLMPAFNPNMPICTKEYQSALTQIGTLGGGNHFIEIQKGSDGYIWIMIHSGSRNLGKKVADYYNNIAIELNEKYFSSVPKEHELAFLPVDSEQGQSYLIEMQYCVDFALANRKLMMSRIIEIFNQELQKENCQLDFFNIAHNYASIENHFGHNVWIHRKGATLARDNIGIIPGSMGSNSYIVKGKSNPESFMSCSHGAGRAMGRKQAIRTLNLENEKKHLDDMGIIHGLRNSQDLDEATGSYKNIDIVIEEQQDLIDILIKLTPIASIKG